MGVRRYGIYHRVFILICQSGVTTKDFAIKTYRSGTVVQNEKRDWIGWSNIVKYQTVQQPISMRNFAQELKNELSPIIILNRDRFCSKIRWFSINICSL